MATKWIRAPQPSRSFIAYESVINTNGFADEHEEDVSVHHAIVGNIDKLLDIRSRAG